jgi:C-terminal processing protease CtpA/Prc
MDKKPLEGIGVTPDIEVAFDPDEYETNGNDTQIDRALQFIRTGN